jgi:hypothetical protein
MGPMQVNATGWGTAEAEEFVVVTQDLDTMTIAETEETNPDDASIGTEESDSTISEEGHRAAQILAGQATAFEYFMESQDKQTRKFLELQQKYIHQEPMESIVKLGFLQDKLEVMSDYRYEILNIKNIVEEQAKETDLVREFRDEGMVRSQQYQDKARLNQLLIPVISGELIRSRAAAKIIKDEIERLRDNENVAKIDHPRHAELAWSFCYTDSCTIHRSSKDGAGYWPNRKRPV